MKNSVWLTICVILLGLLAWSQMNSQMQTVPAPAPAQARVAAEEDHPHIEAAIKSLEDAKHHLETAAHDFGGHRAKALDHTQQALNECREALKYDKK